MNYESGENNIAQLESELTEDQNKFYKSLKEYFVQDKQIPNRELYYYLMLRSSDFFEEVISYANKKHLEIIFNYEKQSEKNSHYHLGDLKISFKDPEIETYSDSFDLMFYNVSFESEDRYWGYCFCKPGDENYDARYDCCGVKNCDDFFPRFSVTKVRVMGQQSFEGNSKLKWDISDEWNGVTEKEIEEKKKKAEIAHYEYMIDHYRKALSDIKDELKS